MIEKMSKISPAHAISFRQIDNSQDCQEHLMDASEQPPSTFEKAVSNSGDNIEKSSNGNLSALYGMYKSFINILAK